MTVALYDAPGPKTKRRILIGSIVGALAIVGLILLILQRLEKTGQFREIFWEPFTQAGVQRILLRGLWATLRAAGVALVLAIALGLVLAVGRLSQRWILRQASGLFVEFFRAMPLVLLIFFAFLGFPRIGSDMSAFGALVFGLTVRIMLPAIISQMVVLLKDSALGFIVASRAAAQRPADLHEHRQHHPVPAITDSPQCRSSRFPS